MHLFGLFLARYIDWCAAFSLRLKGWQLILFEVAIFLGFIVVVEQAPAWIGIVTYCVVGLPAAVFVLVAHRAKTKKQEGEQDRLKQLRRTQKLLKRFGK